MNVQFTTEKCTTIKADAVVVILKNEESATSVLGQAVNEALTTENFKAKSGKTICFPSFGHATAAKIIIAGAGKGKAEDYRQAAGAAGQVARKHGLNSVAIFCHEANADKSGWIVTGFTAGNYKYDRYKTDKDKKGPVENLIIVAENAAATVERAVKINAGKELARDLVNAPAADIYPETLADVALELATDQMSVDVWGEEKIRSEGMGGIIAVGQGSVNPPRFIHMHYKPSGEPRKKIAIIGKGVTFDAGGLSLKPSAGMQTMRCDMAGSAAVIGACKAIAALKPDVEVHGIVGAVENMCAANSYKLGDILTMKNGKTVEVHNTDAEGRLVLADCLSFGSDLGVDAMVDLATLTGANVVALGDYYSGLYTNEEDIAAQLSKSAEATGELLWRLPLPEIYKAKLKAEWGDIKNVGGRAAGSITAALFLSEFVTNTKWAHIDIAGPAFLDKPFRHFASGGTGVMVETLVDWIES